jgi:hypothetical protein
MRVFPLAMILSLATTLMWLGWSTVPAEAGIPGIREVIDNLAGADQDQSQEQGQSAEPAGIFGGLCDPGDCGPRWIIAADAVALQRSTTQSQALFINRIGTTDTAPVDAKDVDFPVAYGPSLSVIRRGPCDWDLEVAYFQFDGFSARATVPGQSVMVTDANGGIFATDAQATYTSALYSVELNVRRQWTDWLNLLAGFRLGQLNERYHADGTGTFVAVPVSLDVNAFNHLYGLQVGANAEVYNMGGPLRIDALCKAGIYVNSARQIDRRFVEGFVDQSLAAERNQTAFIGEVGAVATYALTRHVAFHASAQVAWLEGVALAPEQIGATDFTAGTAGVDAGGELFYVGGGLGFEFRY